MNDMTDKLIVNVKNLSMHFPVLKGILRRKVAEIKAVSDVSFKMQKGKTLGLVGESGCGKTTVGRCLLRLYEPTSGHICFEGKDIAKLPEHKIRPLRRKMGVIFQDPFGSLDPRQSAGTIVGEPLKTHNIVNNKKDYVKKIENLFNLVKLDPITAKRVPHEFSGGQRQRIAIARALACEPDLIICDEPISALDVSIQAQIINLLQELRRKLHLTYLFIAHDLSVVKNISDRVAVMYLGRIVEITNAAELYENPLHPYTKGLLSAVPIANPFIERSRKRFILKGEVPSPMNPPTGCHFHPRCADVIPDCRKKIPPLLDMGDDHHVACLRV